MDKYLETNGIRLHYCVHPGEGPTLVLLHGLTANARAFDAYLAAGLSSGFRLITVDLRGRGQSSKPENGYSMAEHAQDILGLLDAEGLHPAIVGGHSFGGLLSIYLAANFPERISRIIILDAAARLHPQVRDLVAPSMARLGKTWPSRAAFLKEMQQGGHLAGAWNPFMEAYYNADVYELPDGSVTTLASLPHIQQAIDGALGLGAQWLDYIQSVQQPALLIYATGAFGPAGTPPILTRELALETAEMMPNCQAVEVPGNHVTMLYGAGAQATVEAMKMFLR